MHDCHTQRAFMEMHFLGQAKRPPLSLARGDVIGNSGRPCRAAFKAPRLWPQPQNAAAREAKHIALGHVGSCRPLVTRGRPKLWTKGTALVLSYTGGGQRWKGFFSQYVEGCVPSWARGAVLGQAAVSSCQAEVEALGGSHKTQAVQ